MPRFFAPLTSSQKGFTILELLLVLFLVALFTSFTVLAIRPNMLQKRSRDVVRLADLTSLMQAIERFSLENGYLPDDVDTLRVSNVAISSLPSQSDGTGWIGEDMRDHIPALPVDYTNQGDFVFRYRHDGLRYELDASLEYHTNLMAIDGGDDSSKYEIGTDLTLL